jgi:hypothetical protein
MSVVKSEGYRRVLLASWAAVPFLILAHPAVAFEYDLSNGTVINFNNTLEYSLGERTSPESPLFVKNPNLNDGDNNLRAGIISNRIDLLSEFNITDNGYGFDGSVDTFYDSVYNQKTQNGDAFSYNPATQPADKFTTATRTIAGRDIQLRNLYVFGSTSVANTPVTIRVGRFVNIFGESLLFAANGISYGQSPINIEEAVSVPNTQAKNLFLPVGQALLTTQLTDAISVSAYYQFEWEKFNYPPAGSYFNPVDFIGEGGQRLIAFAPTPVSPGGYFYRGRDESGSDTGQFGLAVHYDPISVPIDFGIYALQYNDSEPQVYVRPGAGAPAYIPATNSLSLGTYQMVYANHIQIYGASSSFTYGPTNYAGEISIRKNEDLTSSVPVLPGENANNTNHPRYAIGNTLHYQASAIFLGKATRLWNASGIVAEAAGDNLLGFVKNRANFDPAQRHMALGLRAIFSATYYEVLPALDLSPSLGVGWNFMGLAPDTQGFNNTGIDRGGDLTFGLNATYRNIWTGGVDYTTYVGPPQRDVYADRDFVAVNVERTF